ncbi:Uncharacterised protein [Amycolatopsis camponoti]|uniref:NACHT domain-containing protein n=1 Tax=Amycolatopsis camponoti TaxID=2606593 RepID=A0A6I8LNA0_9PSEU|nr:NACHT domain-containing protein [Amycolatopsis camponoti]VVJ18353.1 Uncharacterised protein [Amycolatopsis camponoti]
MNSEEIFASNLSKDLAAFADPGAEVQVLPASELEFRGSWYQDGKLRSFTFTRATIDSSWPDGVIQGQTRTSYRSFLSGAGMADLRGIARNTINVISALPNYVTLDANLIGEHDETGESLDSSTLIQSLAEPGDGRTNVVFITADAGVGKTSLLRHLVRSKAIQYMEGASSSLWLYVDAQGRRLAQLDEAIAAELDDVRAKIPYHASVPLVRSGALVLVVDGFDELIGSVGSYDEAFSSLANFISDLDGYGCIIAAARSTYYEQEFLTRSASSLGSLADSWILTAVRLLDWSPEKRQQFIQQHTSAIADIAHETINQEIETILQAPEVKDVGYKPFFVSRTLDLLSDGPLPSGSGLLERLVSAYVSREVEQKLRSPINGAPILSEEQYRLLLSEIAEEMWLQETRELSSTSVREIAEIIGSTIGLSGDGLREVVERLPYNALLSRGSLPGSVAFEHDIFYSYFLTEPLSRVWGQRSEVSLERILRRGRLPEEAASLVGKIMRERNNTQALLDVLCKSVLKSSGDREQVSRNAGGLAAGILADNETSGITVSNLTFGDAPFGQATVIRGSFKDCSFVGTNLTTAAFINSEANGSTFDRIIVDIRRTRLELHGLQISNFNGLGILTDSAEEWRFSPRAIQESLAQCGLPDAHVENVYDVRADVVDTLERLCRLYLRTNSLTEDDTLMSRIVANPFWKGILSALVASGTVEFETKQASGRKVFIKRTVRPQDILLGMQRDSPVSETIRDLWQILESEFPSIESD